MNVFVPGASGGFGRVLAAALADHGHTVIGTCRNPAAHADAPVPMLAMEVTDDASVEAAVREVLDREGHIDAVVNCVNQMFIGGVEETSVDEVASLYDTNVFGVLRVCRAVLPSMRERNAGTLVSMSSLGGLIAVPWMSAYTSAKFALEAVSEALYHELRATNIDVVIMQPVAMAMDRPASGDHLHVVAGAAPDSPSHRLLAKMASDTEASGLTPETVAEKVQAVLTSPRKPLRVPMDRARPLGIVKRFAPQGVIDRLVDGLLE